MSYWLNKYQLNIGLKYLVKHQLVIRLFLYEGCKTNLNDCYIYIVGALPPDFCLVSPIEREAVGQNLKKGRKCWQGGQCNNTQTVYK